MKQVFTWKATRLGGLLLELSPTLTVLLVTFLAAGGVARLDQPLQAALISVIGFVGAFFLAVVASRHGISAALETPRLRAAGLAPRDSVSVQVEQTAGHAEAALALAATFRKRGQESLSIRMADGVLRLLKAVLQMDEQRQRLAVLPGERNAEATRKCYAAMEQMDEALVNFSVELAEAGGQQEWSAARVDDALMMASTAKAVAEAMTEVSLCR